MNLFSIVRRTFINRRGVLAIMMAISLYATQVITVRAAVFTNAASITINDAQTVGVGNPYPSTVNVSGMVGTTTNVTLILDNFNHTFPDDMDIMLVSPTGANLVVMSDAGGSADMSNAYMLFDDAAAGPVSDGGPTGSGSFQVSQFVAGDTFPAPAPAPSANTTFAVAFNGADPNGAWTLYVVDDTGVDQGVIGNGWKLQITTTSSVTSTFSNTTPIFLNDRFAKATPYASTINASGLTGAITDVNVTLTNINHLNPDDIDILLVSPSGKSIMLMSDAGGTPDAVNVTITFDDAAASTLADAGPLVAGSFKPSNFGSGDNISDVLPFYANSSSAGPATLASSFNGTDGNGTWSLYVIDDATASTGSISGGWSIDITAAGAFNAKRFTNADFDGDGRTDTSVYRGSDHNWYTRNSSNYANRTQVDWGLPTDVLVPGDYDGDKKCDHAVYRPSEGNWYIIRSGSTPQIINWGGATDIPVPGDYDGDGDTDVAIYRPSEGNWYVRGIGVTGWGAATDTPVPGGDFNGDGLADFVVFRPSEGNWYIKTAAGGSVVNWGSAGDELVPGDYDADGKTDVAVWRPSEGRWYVIQSGTGTGLSRVWGLSGDIPVPGDYDGDARSDFAIFRPSDGNWYLLNSGTTPNVFRIDNLGTSGDSPIPAAYQS